MAFYLLELSRRSFIYKKTSLSLQFVGDPQKVVLSIRELKKVFSL